ncbi:MAG: hypothetical protein R3D56_09505 [Paracoccaceae bacterium]
MNALLDILGMVKRLCLAVAEAGYALVALIILLYLLLGADAGPYVASVMTNLSLLIDAFGQQTLIAIAIVFALGLALRRRVN